MKTLLASLSVLLAIPIGCSTATENCGNVNQDRIYQSLIASYDGETGRTTANATFRFGGASGTTLAVTANETIYAYVRGSTSIDASGNTTTNGATTVTISSARLAELANGAGELYLVRRKSEALGQATSVGGSLLVEYETAHRSITIAD